MIKFITFIYIVTLGVMGNEIRIISALTNHSAYIVVKKETREIAKFVLSKNRDCSFSPEVPLQPIPETPSQTSCRRRDVFMAVTNSLPQAGF